MASTATMLPIHFPRRRRASVTGGFLGVTVESMLILVVRTADKCISDQLGM
jgi:hypothetical protein